VPTWAKVLLALLGVFVLLIVAVGAGGYFSRRGRKAGNVWMRPFAVSEIATASCARRESVCFSVVACQRRAISAALYERSASLGNDAHRNVGRE